MISTFAILFIIIICLSINKVSSKELIDYSLEEAEIEFNSKWDLLNEEKKLKINEHVELFFNNNQYFLDRCAAANKITFTDLNKRDANFELYFKYFLIYYDYIAFERDFDSFKIRTINERFIKTSERDGFKEISDSICLKYVEKQHNSFKSKLLRRIKNSY